MTVHPEMAQTKASKAARGLPGAPIITAPPRRQQSGNKQEDAGVPHFSYI